MEKIKNIIFNIIGSSMLAFGICAFIEPFELVVGGATGIALITHRLLGVNISTVALIINVAVLIPGLFLGGKKLVAGSLLSSFVYPFALAVCERIPHITEIADNIILACICGGVVCGAGIGLVMRSGGSTGGLDIPAILIHKYFHLPVGKTMNAIDVVIMVAQMPFSLITSVLYGIIYTYIMTNALNSVLVFGDDRLKVTIISEAYEEIGKLLVTNDYGVTFVYAEGGLTKTPIKKVECIMSSARYRKCQNLVESIDPTAFITIEKVKDVRGRGFTLERERLDGDWLEDRFTNA